MQSLCLFYFCYSEENTLLLLVALDFLSLVLCHFPSESEVTFYLSSLGYMCFLILNFVFHKVQKIPILVINIIFDFIYFLLEFFFKRFLFIYLTERQPASERGNTSRGSGRGRNRLPSRAGSPMPGSNPGPWDHVLGRRQMLND